jgi:DNA processing protein
MEKPQKYEVREISRNEYLPQLLEIPQVPEKLWIRGEMPPSDIKYLAVVGSRALSSYGREACETLIAGLAGQPISIISGLALGADACAHKNALLAGLHTIAVPGSGLADDSIGPRANFGLSREILKAGGALMSEHPPEYLAQPHDFPSRNRIMVGMADAVLVIEAGEKSGTLITARMAGDYNRELLCVPHRIGDTHGYGANLFLRLGATLVSESAHVLEALGLETETQSNEVPRTLPILTQKEHFLYSLLEIPLPRDEVIRTAGLPAHEVITTLAALEMKGVVCEQFGAWRRV